MLAPATAPRDWPSTPSRIVSDTDTSQRFGKSRRTLWSKVRLQILGPAGNWGPWGDVPCLLDISATAGNGGDNLAVHLCPLRGSGNQRRNGCLHCTSVA